MQGGASYLIRAWELGDSKTRAPIDITSALELAEEVRPDIVFLNVVKPGPNEAALQFRIRLTESSENILVVEMSGLSDSESLTLKSLASVASNTEGKSTGEKHIDARSYVRHFEVCWCCGEWKLSLAEFGKRA